MLPASLQVENELMVADGLAGADRVSADPASVALVARCRQGDEQAERELFDRYLCRLLGLVRSRLSNKLRGRLDPEDVLQSAYRSFFAGLERDRYVLERSGDLWRLLSAIALHKLMRQIKRHRAGKRNVGLEARVLDGDSLLGLAPEAIADEPSVQHALAVVEELEQVMVGLDDVRRQMLELRLQGLTLEEVAAKSGRSERTVRRLFEKLQVEFEQRLQAAAL